MAAKVYDRVKVATSTTGTGTLTLGGAHPGFRTFTSAVGGNETIYYVIEDGINWEIGTGLFTLASSTLTRSVLLSTNSNAAINLSGNAVVFSALPKELIDDKASLISPQFTGTPTVNGEKVVGEAYLLSRRENLITNGNALMASDYNFSSFTYDATDGYNTRGCFTATGDGIIYTSDDVIPVNPVSRYKLSLYAKASPNVSATSSFGLSFFDVDGNEILPIHVGFSSGTTTLAAQLDPDDTTIVLTNSSGWDASTGSDTSKRGIIIWNYTSSGGISYSAGTYSRNAYPNLWAADSSVNTTTHTITLSSPWAGPTVAAGTTVSRSAGATSNKYIAASASTIPGTWTAYSGVIEGVDTTGTWAANTFPPGTYFVKTAYNMNNGATGGGIKIANIEFEVDKYTAVANTKEPAISAGTTSQYWRGDKSWQTLDKVAVGLSNVDNTSDVNKPISTATQSALNLKADLVAGKIPSSQLPALALTDVNVVASEAAQLALTAEEGDVAVRSDQNKTYIHNGGTAGTMADWTEMVSPTDAVTSVNGETGAVTLTATEVGAVPSTGGTYSGAVTINSTLSATTVVAESLSVTGVDGAIYVNDRDGVGTHILYNSTNVFRIYIDGTDRFQLNASGDGNFIGGLNTAGNVGIGATAAYTGSRLHVRHDLDNTTTGIIVQNRSTTGASAGIFFLSSGLDISDNRYAMIRSGGGAAPNLDFYVANGTSPYRAGGFTAAGNFEAIGAITTNSSLYLGVNGTALFFKDAGGSSPYFTMQGDNNFVFYSTDASGAGRPIWSNFGRSNSSTFNVAVGADFTSTISAGGSITATNGTSAVINLTKTGTNAGTADLFNDGALHIRSSSGNDNIYYNSGAHHFYNRAQTTLYGYWDSTGLYLGSTNRLLLHHNASDGYIRTETSGGNLFLGAGASTILTLGGGVATYLTHSALDNSTKLATTAFVQQERATRLQTAASDSITPTFNNDFVIRTGASGAITLNNPTGTAIHGHGLVIRLKDNGTARAISYGTQYRAIGVTLPTTTVVNKTVYLAMIYNATDTKWDVTAVAQEA